MSTDTNKEIDIGSPDTEVSVKKMFGIDSDLTIPAYKKTNDYVPEIDKDYLFNKDTTLAILAGFKHDRRVMIQGYHGTGKSTHIEQIAAKLNWPCVRINFERDYFHGLFKIQLPLFLMNMMLEDQMLCLLFKEF